MFEQQLIQKIETGIKRISKKEITPKDANLAPIFNKLKEINPGMCQDLMNNYKQTLSNLK